MASFDGLDRMNALLEALGHPEAEFRAFHIAGTNGKGSTAVMIASILEEAGYSVGLFTSPHLEDECERVQIWDGTHRMIDKDVLSRLKEYVKSTLHAEVSEEDIDVKSTLHKSEDNNVKQTLHNEGGKETDDVKSTLHHEDSNNVKLTLHKAYGNLTVFEIYTAAAYLYFKEQKPDFVVLETGLGGRLDSTNTLEKPLASVITQVGLDHTRELGRTVEQIAHEKAGIIKPDVPVISASTDPIAKEVIRREAKEKGAPFIDASEMTDKYRDYELSMKGEHQAENAAAAAEAIKASGVEVSAEAIECGLAAAHLPGRIEVIEEDPYWIVDGAHNPNATEALVKTFNEFKSALSLKRTLVIFGCMQDKNLERMIQLLSDGLSGCEYASCAVDYSRAEDPALIAEKFEAAGARCMAFDSVRAAYEHAKSSDYDCILVSGSIYLAGEMRSLYMHDHKKTE